MSKAEKVSSTIEFCIFELVLLPNFILTDNFDFLDCICPKKVFPVLNRKSDNHYRILFIGISLVTKIKLKLTILNFWTKFSQKGISSLKQKKLTSLLSSVYSN